MKTENEINKELDRVYTASDKFGDKYSGMSYEDGIKAALNWVMEYEEEPPYPEED